MVFIFDASAASDHIQDHIFSLLYPTLAIPLLIFQGMDGGEVNSSLMDKTRSNPPRCITKIRYIDIKELSESCNLRYQRVTKFTIFDIYYVEKR